jgi:mycothiol synthase
MTRASLSPTMDTGDRARLVERSFDPATDLPAMVDLISEVNAFDDVPWFPTIEQLEVDWAPAPGFDPPNDALLIEEGGRVVAAAQQEWRERDGKIVHVIEPWVRPAARRRGIGRRLVEWSEARAGAAVAAGTGGSPDLPHVLSMGTATHVAPAMAFAEALGYERIRYGFIMRRDLAQPIEDAPMPEGLETRPVTPDQHRRIWDADVEAFRDHWEAAVRHDEDFVRFFANPDLDTTMWQVAWDGDEVAGSVVNGIYPAENARLGVELGWLDHVSVRRPWRGRGLAGALIARSLRVLRDRGMAFASLGVDAENPTGALGLYERHGFTVHQTFVTFRKPL